MYILGLTTMGESSAVLLKNGVPVAAAEEERFTRAKHEGCFPIRSIDFCLRHEGIALADVGHIGVYWQPWRVRTRLTQVLSTAISRPGSFVRKMSRSIGEFLPKGGGTVAHSEGSWLELFQVRKLLTGKFGAFHGRLHYLDHHRCHMASAFFTSPFDEATILVIDGAGEEFSTTMAVGSGNQLKALNTIAWPHSLGHFYSSMTGFLGFRMLDGEYKMMGLAPYNSPDYADFIRKHILITDRPGSFHLNTRILDYHDARTNRFSAELMRVFGKPRPGENEPFLERHQKIASSAQAAFEDVVLDLARWAFAAGGKKRNLCIAGGCGLNCTANGKLLREGLFERLFIPPVPHDPGAALGAALLVHHEVLGQPREFVMDHAYYGPQFTEATMARALVARNIDARPIRDEDRLIDLTARSLARGDVVAWFQGKMEFGPRALGNRSFLADPRNDAIRDTINRKIKKRELFRPFAPSVKEECASEYFDIQQPSPFMNITAPTRTSKQTAIPAVVHVDGTARIQTVNRRHNPRYWKLLDRFHQLTGVPVLLNTSFNIQEPIVCSPEEAVNTYRSSLVDVLVLGDHFVTRQPHPEA